MLGPSTRVAVPAVVRDVDQHIGALRDELTYFVGENRFVADEDTQPLISCPERLVQATAREISDGLCETSGKRKNRRERHVFAKRDQMNFAVASGPFAAGTDHG